MGQQKLFRQVFLDDLYLKIKHGTGIDLFRNNEFQFDEKNCLFMPHVEKPLGLKLKMNTKDDFESAIVLFESYRNLTPLEAADPRFWNYLSISDLYTYVRERYPNVYKRKDGINEEAYIYEHFLLENSSELMRVHLPSLWWSVYLSYDKDNSDPYHLTKVLFWSIDVRTRTLGPALLGRKKEIMHGVLDYLNERGKGRMGSVEDLVREITKFLNKFGGSKTLCIYSRSEIKDIVEKAFPIPDDDDNN
jgi:hypothetical protein